MGLLTPRPNEPIGQYMRKLAVIVLLMCSCASQADYLCKTVKSIEGRRVGSKQTEVVEGCDSLQVNFVIKARTADEMRAARSQCDEAINRILYKCCADHEGLREAQVATIPERAPAGNKASLATSVIECR